MSTPHAAFVLLFLATTQTGPRAQSPEPTGVVSFGWVAYDSQWGRDCTAIGAALFGMALHSDGTLTRWGHVPSPPPPLPPGTTYVAFVLGGDSALALRSDHQLVHWGPNYFGEGNIPPAPAGLHYVRLARTSGYHRGAFLSDGSLVEWGAPYELGAIAPPLPPGLSWQNVHLGGYHALGVRSDGTVVGWGRNGSGQTNAPPLPPGVVYSDVATLDHSGSTALRSDGSFVFWGIPSSIPMTPLPTGPFTRMAAAVRFTALLRADGEVVVFGSPYYAVPLSRPPITSGPGFVEIAAGMTRFDIGFVIALRTDGRLVAWGGDSMAQCNGPGAYPDADFVRVTGSGGNNEGGSWSCGLTRAGQILTWGGRVQDHVAPQFDAPPLPPGVVYTGIAGGTSHAVALRSDGLVACFGVDTNGQFGLPAPAPGTTYVGVGAGPVQSFALRSDGALVGAGFNSAGQCNPPPLPPGSSYVGVDGSEWCTIALRSDGQLVAFGDTAAFGQGQVPPLPAGLVWRSISLGAYHAVALRSDGQLIAWGNNNAGQCNVPPPPPGVVYVEAVASPGTHTVARRSDGVVVAFGNNSSGQCSVPAPAPGRGFVGIDAGGDSTVLLTGAPSTYVRVGSGCGTVASALIPRDTPHVGAELRVAITDLPFDLAVLATGFDVANSPLGPFPVDLGPHGVPGCQLFAGLDLLDAVIGTGGRAEWSVAVPYLQAFIGLRFRQQAIVFDTAMSNAYQVRMSDAGEGQVGR